MANPSLIAFIKNARLRGYDDPTIRNVLIKKGWAQSQVQEALVESKGGVAAAAPKLQTSAKKAKKPMQKNMKVLLWSALILFLIAAGVIAFVLFYPSAECDTDRDCGSGYSCSNSECVYVGSTDECVSDSDCASDEECSFGSCVAVTTTDPDPEPECVVDDECPTNYECISNTCEPIEECVSDDDCDSGEECVEGICYVADDPLGDISTPSNENYAVSSLSLNTLTETEGLFDLSFTYENLDSVDGSETQVVSISCTLSDDVGDVVDEVIVEFNHTLNMTDLETNCTVDVTDFYATVASGVAVDFTLEMMLDYHQLIDESDESDNDMEIDYTWEPVATAECTEDANCSSGYECVSGVCEEIVATSGCSDDSECSAYTCDTSVSECYSSCEDLSTAGVGDDSLCQTGYLCVENDDGSGTITFDCEEDPLQIVCVDNSDCPSGYACDSTASGLCAEDADGSGVPDYLEAVSVCEDSTCGAYVCEDESACYASCDPLGGSEECANDYACNEDGVCVDLDYQCVDSDGENYEEVGVVTLINYYNESMGAYHDRCGSSDPDNLIEYTCRTGSLANYEKPNVIDCTEVDPSYTCVNGRCADPATIVECEDLTDNDGDGTADNGGCDCDNDGYIDSFVGTNDLAADLLCRGQYGLFDYTLINEDYGTSYENECTGSGTYYYPDAECSLGDVESECVVDADCGANQICSDFVCVDLATEIVCSVETDAGVDPENYGIVESDDGSITIEDSCVVRSTGELWETYCSSEDMFAAIYQCTDSCASGACTSGDFDRVECNAPDTDNNNDPFELGEISVGSGTTNGEDYCLDENTLLEYYCATGVSSGLYGNGEAQVYDCHYACSNGACTTEPQCNDGYDIDGDGGYDFEEKVLFDSLGVLTCTEFVDTYGGGSGISCIDLCSNYASLEGNCQYYPVDAECSSAEDDESGAAFAAPSVEESFFMKIFNFIFSVDVSSIASLFV